MEETYNGHKIVASAWQLSEAGKWEPRVFITWNEGFQEKKAPLVFTRPFTDELEAEKEGIRMAKKWIDDGKPEVHVGPT